MLSSLGFDPKGSRNARNNSKYVLEVPRGFSVHVFKTPSPPAPQQSVAGKTDFAPSRTTPSLPWKPSSYSPSRPDSDRKPSFGRSDSTRPEQVTEYDRGLDLTRSKSSKPYGIVPSAIPDTYIYEPSISSVADLPGSPSSSSSSDTDSVDGFNPFVGEVSSIRASSSVETLEATSYFALNRDASAAPANSPYGSTRGPVIPPSSRQLAYASRYTTADRDDDDDTVVSEDHAVSRSTAQPTSTGSTTTPTIPQPVRRNSDERSSRVPAPTQGPSSSLSRRDSASRSRSTSPATYPGEGEANLRLPPGLQPAAPVQTGGPGTLHRSNTSPTLPSQRSSPEAIKPPLTRILTAPEGELAIAAAKRSVRWTEDLVCPSPILPSQRRKGWFNRRGDQLWTNAGGYKAVEPGLEYPSDLANYPEPGSGWMNEEGTKIDMQHRLVPKPPLRSALKRSKNSSQSIPEELSIN